MKRVIKREPDDEDLKFLQNIYKDELLFVEDDVKLVKQVQQADGDVHAAKDKLMRSNQRFVRIVAQKYASRWFTIDELIAEGNKGLEQAIYKFDETKGFKFIIYALWWIRNNIQQAIVLKARAERESQELTKRELDILCMYFGIGCDKKTLEEIQAKYELTPQRAIFIKNIALRKLHFAKS